MRAITHRALPSPPLAVGTGAALRLIARGEADVVLVHAPEAGQREEELG
jgi:ABC-type tungstate transport system permease subunit